MSVSVNADSLIIRDLGMQDYQSTWERMRDFTDSRTDETLDEIWLLQHPPIFTQGLAGKPEHVLNPHDIPIIQTDRGGQITYHGPGQLVAYVLIDLTRKQLYTRDLVRKLENSLITLLHHFHIMAQAKCDAPGVYVNDAKIASIGLRVRRNASYHGIALNVDMDLTPFSYINPCGHRGMSMTHIKTFVPGILMETVKKEIVPAFLENFGYTATTYFANEAATEARTREYSSK